MNLSSETTVAMEDDLSSLLAAVELSQKETFPDEIWDRFGEVVAAASETDSATSDRSKNASRILQVLRQNLPCKEVLAMMSLAVSQGMLDSSTTSRRCMQELLSCVEKHLQQSDSMRSVKRDLDICQNSIWIASQIIEKTNEMKESLIDFGYLLKLFDGIDGAADVQKKPISEVLAVCARQPDEFAAEPGVQELLDRVDQLDDELDEIGRAYASFASSSIAFLPATRSALILMQQFESSAIARKGVILIHKALDLEGISRQDLKKIRMELENVLCNYMTCNPFNKERLFALEALRKVFLLAGGMDDLPGLEILYSRTQFPGIRAQIIDFLREEVLKREISDAKLREHVQLFALASIEGVLVHETVATELEPLNAGLALWRACRLKLEFEVNKDLLSRLRTQIESLQLSLQAQMDPEHGGTVQLRKTRPEFLASQEEDSSLDTPFRPPKRVMNLLQCDRKAEHDNAGRLFLESNLVLNSIDLLQDQ